MVGRLVEEEEIRLGEQSGCQGDTHAPAAGEILSRFLLRRLANSETGQNRRRARRRRLGANIMQAGLDFRDAVRVLSGLGLGEEGAALGSNSGRALRAPRVLLVYDSPGQTNSVGFARYVLEQRYAQPTVAVRASSLGRANLADYDVIVFPSGNYSNAVNSGMVEELRNWMSNGGTMITMAASTAWAIRAELLSTTAERRGGRAVGDDPPSNETPDQPIEYLDEIVPEDEGPESVPGAILRTLLDTEHWLASGTDGEIGVLVQGNRVFTPMTLDNGTNVGRYGDLDNLVLSGIVWDEARPQLANKAFLMYESYGSGQIVAFAEDPNYRAYTEASELLFMNAVLLGPGR